MPNKKKEPETTVCTILKPKPLTLSDYAAYINKLVADGHGDKTVVYACDEEGNQYYNSFYAPSMIKVEDIRDVYIPTGKDVAEVVCIN